MPAINLPTIDIDREDFKSKETMEQILDTLIKYRKELNYLLMNLDIDNMPLVGDLIGDLEGDYSLLQQTIDGILIQVGNQAGDIADLSIRADAITATVGDNAGNIAQLQVQADQIQATVANNAGDISSLTQTAQGIQTQVSNNAGDISILTQTAQGIQTQVSDNAGDISILTQTAQGIQAQVSSVDSEVGTLSSEITVVAGQVSSKVSYTDYNGEEIASLINQDARRITISAEALDLTGVTSIYGRYSGDYAQFDGSAFGVFVDHTQRFVIDSRYYGTSIYLHDAPLLSAAYYDDDDYMTEVYFQRPITMHSNPTGSRQGYNITSTSESGRCYIDATTSGIVVRDQYGSVLGSLFF